MKINLYDYQKDAVDRLRSGSILCAAVGIGKSITALAYFVTRECGGSLFIESNLKNPRFRKIDLYIISTAKKRDDRDWQKEAQRFSIFEDRSKGIGIQLKVDSWNNISKYTDVRSAFFIFDEQRVVGYGKWVKSFLKISRSNGWILLINENRHLTSEHRAMPQSYRVSARWQTILSILKRRANHLLINHQYAVTPICAQRILSS